MGLSLNIEGQERQLGFLLTLRGRLSSGISLDIEGQERQLDFLLTLRSRKDSEAFS